MTIRRGRRARVVPVIRTNSTAHAWTAVEWLRESGFRVFEITMTVPDAPALMREQGVDVTANVFYTMFGARGLDAAQTAFWDEALTSSIEIPGSRAQRFRQRHGVEREADGAAAVLDEGELGAIPHPVADVGQVVQ